MSIRVVLGASTHWEGWKLMKWQTRLQKELYKSIELDIILGRKEFKTILNHKIKGKVTTAMEEKKEREVPLHKGKM